MTGDALGLAAGLVREIWICVQNVKVYKRRCNNLAWRCTLLINALTDNAAEIAPLPADEAQETLRIVRGRVEKWADLNIFKSILAQREINEGVNDLHQRIDTCLNAYHVRIGQELVHGQRVQALAAERDRSELLETLRDLQEKLSRSALEARAYAPYSLLHSAILADENVLRNSDDGNTNTRSFDDEQFDNAMQRFCTSLETLDLKLAMDTVSGNPLSYGPLSSQISVVARVAPVRPRRQMLSLPLRLPAFPNSRWPSSVSLSCPQIPPLDFEYEVTEYFPNHPLLVESSSPLSTRSSVRSEPSSMLPSRSDVPTGSGDGTRATTTSLNTVPGTLSSPLSVHSSEPSSVLSGRNNFRSGSRPGTQATTPSFSSAASGTSSPLDMALSTRTSMLCSMGNPRIITKGTMEGLVRYLLLNPADTEHHDIFFIGHPAFISPQGILKILIRQFDEASAYVDDMRDMNVMGFIKKWLTNPNVILGNDVLAEVQTFADTVNSSNSLRELALEILQCIPDKAALNFPFSSTISCNSRPDTKPTASQLAVALATLERERYLHILAAEYIAHACKLTSYSPNLQEALDLSQRIANWVISSILECDNLKGRADIKTFFVQVAKECRQIRNFSSICTIVGALQSEVISCLDLTHKAMSHKEQRRLQKLGTLVTPESNYGTYRAAVQRDDKRGCIPWHNVHLHDIAIVLQEEDVEEHHEAPLINFQKWAHLKEKALDAMRYRGIRLEYDENGLETAMAYLTQQFQPVAINDDFSRLLQTKSARLRQSEDAIRRDTVRRSVGFG